MLYIWLLIASYSPHWNNPYLSHARTQKFASLHDIFFGSQDSTTEGKNIAELLVISQTGQFQSVIFNVSYYQRLKNIHYL